MDISEIGILFVLTVCLEYSGCMMAFNLRLCNTRGPSYKNNTVLGYFFLSVILYAVCFVYGRPIMREITKDLSSIGSGVFYISSLIFNTFFVLGLVFFQFSLKNPFEWISLFLYERDKFRLLEKIQLNPCHKTYLNYDYSVFVNLLSSLVKLENYFSPWFTTIRSDRRNNRSDKYTFASDTEPSTTVTKVDEDKSAPAPSPQSEQVTPIPVLDVDNYTDRPYDAKEKFPYDVNGFEHEFSQSVLKGNAETNSEKKEEITENLVLKTESQTSLTEAQKAQIVFSETIDELIHNGYQLTFFLNYQTIFSRRTAIQEVVPIYPSLSKWVKIISEQLCKSKFFSDTESSINVIEFNCPDDSSPSQLLHAPFSKPLLNDPNNVICLSPIQEESSSSTACSFKQTLLQNSLLDHPDTQKKQVNYFFASFEKDFECNIENSSITTESKENEIFNVDNNNSEGYSQNNDSIKNVVTGFSSIPIETETEAVEDLFQEPSQEALNIEEDRVRLHNEKVEKYTASLKFNYEFDAIGTFQKRFPDAFKSIVDLEMSYPEEELAKEIYSYSYFEKIREMVIYIIAWNTLIRFLCIKVNDLGQAILVEESDTEDCQQARDLIQVIKSKFGLIHPLNPSSPCPEKIPIFIFPIAEGVSFSLQENGSTEGLKISSIRIDLINKLRSSVFDRSLSDFLSQHPDLLIDRRGNEFSPNFILNDLLLDRIEALIRSDAQFTDYIYTDRRKGKRDTVIAKKILTTLKEKGIFEQFCKIHNIKDLKDEKKILTRIIDALKRRDDKDKKDLQELLSEKITPPSK